MEQENKNQLLAAEAGLQILDLYHEEWENLEAWENAQAALVENIEQIHATDVVATTDYTGAARTKKTIRLETGAKANVICGPLKSFLLSIPDENQEATVHFSKSQLVSASQTTLSDRWTLIIQVAKKPDNAAFYTGGYGITSQMITSLQEGVDEFNLAVPKPKANKAIKAAANKDLKAEFKTLATVKATVLNLAQGKSLSNKTFYEALVSAFGISDTGTFNQNAVLTFRDFATNVILYKVKATFTKGSQSFVKYSTKSGKITIKGKEQGNWTVLIEAETYVSQNLTNVSFDPEKPILKMTIKLVKA